MRLAFIGGNGHHYLKGLLKEPELHLTIAVASDGYDTPAAERFAGNLGPAAWFDSPQKLFEEFQPEIVSIGAVYGHNGDFAAMALAHDVKVVSDKPIAASWEQWGRLREITEGTSRVLLTEFPFRAQREFRAARRAVQSGAIGEVVLATAQKSYRFGLSRPAWYAQREEYGGTLLWVASHGIDALQYCTGQGFARVIGVQGNLSRPDYASMEDHCVALFELKNGGSGVVHADFLRPQGAPTHGDDRLRIAGSKGVVEVREGRCLLINAEGEHDITESANARPVHLELLAALRGECDELYSTTASLQTAEILLRARDAGDARSWHDC